MTEEAEQSIALGRMRAQLLDRSRETSVESCVERLVAIQAQDPRGFRLAVRPRTTGTRAVDVDEALNARRVLVTWLNRGTLHLVRAVDYWWLHPLTAPPLARSLAARLRRIGVSEGEVDHGTEVILNEVRTRGPRNRDELRRAVDESGVTTEGQALIYMIGLTSALADLVRGPIRERTHCFVSASQWLGPAPEPVDRRATLALLTRRYLAGHQPADPRDLSVWSGLTLTDARLGFAALGDEITQLPSGQFVLTSPPASGRMPRPRLLGPFDPLLHGWASRDWVTKANRNLITTNGIFRAFALVDGEAAATWAVDGDRVVLRPFRPLDPGVRTALDADGLDVLRYLGIRP